VTSHAQELAPATAKRTAAADDDAGGRIAFRVRIGVTGHRTLTDEDAVAARVRAALEQLRGVFAAPPATPVRFTILSALAEGADRLVVREAYAVLADDVRVDAVLPRDAGDYMEDFASTASKREFENLLAGASPQAMPKALSQTEGYERAGRYVVEQCDVLLAIWDGRQARGRGGTAEVVAYARQRGTPVMHIEGHPDDEPPAVDDDLPSTPSGEPPSLDHPIRSLRRLEEYNAPPLRAAAFQRALADERSRLAGHLRASPIREEVERIAAWTLPHYVRAEVRAMRYQRAHHTLGDLLYLLAALAVTAVAAQSVFAPERTRLVAAEIVCLVGVLAVFLTARFGRVHDRWMGYRSLAEAFRSALFVALTGARARYERTGAVDLRDPKEPWYQRAFTEAWNERPHSEDAIDDEEELRRFVVAAWLDHQIHYHRQTADHCAARHHRVTVTVTVLSAMALTVAILHFFQVGEGTDWPKWLTFLAIALPGFGAAVTGIREHRQYRLHGKRSARTADRLKRMRDQIETGVRDLSLRGLTAEAQTIIVEESFEWSGVQEFQELEIVL
jgi:hypothetical protein